jgi:hypothetical protein
MRSNLIIALALVMGAVGCGSAASNEDESTNSAISVGASSIFVAPNGSGASCTQGAPCSIAQAQHLVQQKSGAMTGDITVNVTGGNYYMTSPLVLTAADSGSNGHRVIWQGASNTVLSGGLKVTSAWAHPAGEKYWSTQIPPSAASIRPRQIYVNGIRAIRARGQETPPGYAPTASGFTTTNASSIATWANPTEIEFSWFASWKNFHCGVAWVKGNAITMQQPCLAAATTKDLPTKVQWIENARELLDEEGEFYLDYTTGELDYIPRAGETMATAEVIVPVLETVVSGVGTDDAPVHDVTFSNVTFSHTTWLSEVTNIGYTSDQAGVTDMGPLPGGVAFSHGHNIDFNVCAFSHIGTAGLSLESGSQDDVVIGSTFTDISGNAIQLGRFTDDDSHPADARDTSFGDVIQDNFITHAGVEFLDSVGILAGYVESTTITHNDLFALPYTGISVGYTTDAASGSNVITWNEVSYHMRQLNDGGGIYVLGKQPSSIIHFNSIHDLGSDISAAIYLDGGSQDFDVENNVLLNNPYWGLVQAIKAQAASNNTFTNNWHDPASLFWTKSGASNSSNTIADGTELKGAVSTWPAEAITVYGAAGLEPQFRFLHPTNLAVGRPSKASTTRTEGGDFSAPLANDDIAKDGWSPATSDRSPWWQVDLGNVHTLQSIEIPMRWGSDDQATRQNFEVLGSNDPNFGTYTVLATQGESFIRSQDIWSAQVKGAYRYVRVAKTAPEYFYLAEVRVLGE